MEVITYFTDVQTALRKIDNKYENWNLFPISIMELIGQVKKVHIDLTY